MATLKARSKPSQVLEHLGARTVILTGLSADICVMFTAMDAYLRLIELGRANEDWPLVFDNARRMLAVR